MSTLMTICSTFARLFAKKKYLSQFARQNVSVFLRNDKMAEWHDSERLMLINNQTKVLIMILSTCLLQFNRSALDLSYLRTSSGA